jgi:methylmalonyl-CoA mutase
VTVTPDDAVMTLAGDFPTTSLDRWQELVAGVVNRSRAEDERLSGPDAVGSLTTTLADGIVVQPLYQGGRTPLGLPGAMPFTRGTGPRNPDQPWDVRQLFEGTDAEQVRRAVLDDLERGVTSVWVSLGDGYLAPADLAAALDGVLLDLAPVAVSSVTEQGAAAEALLAVLEAAPSVAPGSSLGLDPIGSAAVTGQAADLTGLAPFVRRAAAVDGLVALTVDSRVYHDAGATDVEEVALAVSTAVAYVRALEDDGVSPAEAFAAIDFRVAATADQFSTIAKLRALRRLWARVGELAEVPEEVRGARTHAVTSSRMLTATDPWVNVLRGTIACFAASAGGADRITVLPYDTPMGLPEAFSRRLARNTQSLLALESHVAAVADPAGGSWYVETLTDEMAQRAWTRLGEVDAAGGVAAMLADGSLATALEAMWAERQAGLSSRSIPLTGTSTFPLADETSLTRTPRPQAPTGGLTRHRDGEVFEQLRGRSAAGQAPEVLLVSPGTRRDFGARQTFAGNLLAVAGIGADLAEGVDVAGAAEAARSGGHTVAVLATSPKVNASAGAEVVAALREAGVSTVVLAGRAAELGEGDHDVLEAREGVDVVALLTDLLDRLGAGNTEGDAR